MAGFRNNHDYSRRERRMVKRAGTLLTGGVTRRQADRGEVAVASCDLNARSDRGWRVGGKDTHPIKRRPVIVWHVHADSENPTWQVVPISSSTSSALTVSYQIVNRHGQRQRRQGAVIPRLITLHTSAVQLGVVVGRISYNDIDRICDWLHAGQIIDLTATTGDRPVRLHVSNGRPIWPADAALDELRRRRAELVDSY